jgi:hypothetical protein
MENITEFHKKNIELKSNIQFYKQEINFLLKILTKEYTISITDKEIVKLLDSYWKEFEKYLQKLEGLELNIKYQELEILSFYKNNGNEPKKEIEEEKIATQYLSIVNSLKTIKESLYNYLESDLKRKLNLSLL